MNVKTVSKKTFALFSIISAVILSFLITPYTSVGAISPYYVEQGILLYDKSAKPPTTCTPGGLNSLTGANGQEKVWNFLIQKQLTPEQAAGIAGNLSIESGFIPDNQQDNSTFPNGGWGLAQWTGSRRTMIANAVQAAGLPYTNEATPADKIDALMLFELNYMYSEASGGGQGDPIYGKSIEALQNSTVGLTGEAAVAAAAASWHATYERSADATPQNRIDEGKRIYNLLKSASVLTTSSSAGCTTSTGFADGFTYFSQYDPAWANKAYGSSTILKSGCGPTSMAMAISTLSGKVVTPFDVASWGGQYYIPGQGSSHELFTATAAHWGLKALSVGNSEAAVRDTIAKGGLVVAGGQGAYPYTSGGHIIVIRGITPSGGYLVGNPLPRPADQNKSSADVLKNTEWFTTEYTWAQVSAGNSGMYAITK